MSHAPASSPTAAPVYSWGSTRPFNAYGTWIKERFGERIQKLSVDAGFTCPNRDGVKAYGGCTYCNNASFVPPYCQPGMSVAEQVRAGIDFFRQRYGAERFFVYFQAYSNTYAPLDFLKQLYGQALDQPGVIGLAIGTRPDCVEPAKIDYLASLAKTHFISLEYGLESRFDRSLERLNRAATVREWEEAMAMSAGRGLHLVTHLILGLPGETRDEMVETADWLSGFPLDSLKLHHLHIVEKTALATEYRRDPFPLFAFEDYRELVVDFLERLRPDITLQRLVGETHPEHLIAPTWNVHAGTATRLIEERLMERGSWQGKYWNGGSGRRNGIRQ